MTKGIIEDRKKQLNSFDDYAKQVEKFLNEFAIKDTPRLSSEQHSKLMEDHFYWVDKEENQGYHIPDDIEGTRRLLLKRELGIYEHLYYDATIY